VDHAKDQVLERAGDGMDTVEATVSWRLGSNLENVVLLGDANLSATGNRLNNLLVGNTGKNVLRGGAGFDTASYEFAGTSVHVDLKKSSLQDTGGGGRDKLIGIEHLRGSPFDDVLLGNGKTNTLEGSIGNDELNGGRDHDVLVGGAGADAFVFSCKGQRDGDTIADFSPGEDKFCIDQRLVKIGNGDALLESALVTGGQLGFENTAELVIFPNPIIGALNAKNAASAIGSATSPYEKGQTALFVIDNGEDTGVFHFKSSGVDAAVTSPELTLLGIMTGITETTSGDYQALV